MFSQSYIIYIIISVLCFVPAIVLHEVAHGFAAHKLGDPCGEFAYGACFGVCRLDSVPVCAGPRGFK